ncbi:MAG: hypothetical protein ACR652_18850 [Methylocystis sp.]|uniref:hypothetical protein n=1 Tax=Methylocystis sp. TaxID=1911079 RepID=UPI003DA2AC69
MAMHAILEWLTGASPQPAQTLLGASERRMTSWLAASLPGDVEPVQMSLVGAVGAVVAAAALMAASHWRWLVWVVPPAMGVNWLGLSVDLPLARQRRGGETSAEGMTHHLCEIFSHLLLILAYGGSPFLTVRSATIILFCYLLFSSYVYIRAAARRAERMAFIGIGVTEFRLLLALWPLFALAVDLPAMRDDALPAVDIAVMSLAGVAILGFVGKLVLDGRRIAAAPGREP